MKKTSRLLASFTAMVFAGASHVHAASAITELTWNDLLNGDVTSSSGDGATNADIDIDRASTLVSFKVGTDAYSSFVFANSTNASGTAGLTPYWGINAANLTAADDGLSVTDTRLDTGMVNISDSANDFGFASSPTSLDQVVFIFDVGSADGPLDVVLIDGLGGSVVGSSVNMNSSVASIADIDFERVSGTGTVPTVDTPVKGLAFTLSEFGLTTGQLSSVAGVRINNGAGFDPALVGFTVPEPSTTALLGLGGLALILRRRK